MGPLNKVIYIIEINLVVTTIHFFARKPPSLLAQINIYIHPIIIGTFISN
jgi:hypothetical protein